MRAVLTFLAVSFANLLFAQGYQFLGSYTANGTPLYFVESDVVSTELLTLIDNSLPESYPVPQYNPQYISSGYDTDVKLIDSADVWITFVKEGAGYKNVIGFYTYDLANPRTTAPTNAEITIIFPNFSAANSGGSLVAGNKVKIGHFPAGTGIGWVLFANGWNGTQVTNGNWRVFSNPSFNPEANAADRQHNVIINDTLNQLLIVGFEDIRRDYGSCDQDFNDAIFYVTASPYAAMDLSNTIVATAENRTTSGNDGGLESNGDLANLIAKRNFNRVKTSDVQREMKQQRKFLGMSATNNQRGTGTELATLFPTTAMFGTETAYISTPNDLVNITNAEEVYAVDYYNNTDRVVAVLSTKTTGEVYNHSKMICDRLNGASIEDVRTVSMGGHELIMTRITQRNGIAEYVVSFSVQDLTTNYNLHSLWNIAQYPAGNYINFQVWGASMGQVSTITNYILARLNEEKEVLSEAVTNRIPSVFVKKGAYKNGKVHLTLKNKSASNSISFSANKKETELAETTAISQNISIPTLSEAEIAIETGGLFDIGISITGNNSPQYDAFYLADGPWGIDYLATEATISSFNIEAATNLNSSPNAYAIERNASVTGSALGTVNLFRHILAGDLYCDASEYSTVNFDITSSQAIELVMVTENTIDWNDRLRFQLPANGTSTAYGIGFEQFTSPNGAVYQNEKIKGFVFSIIGNYTDAQPFNLQVNNVALDNQLLLSTDATNVLIQSAYAYPNPFEGLTTLVIPTPTAKVQLKTIDLMGRTLRDETIYTNNNQVTFNGNELPNGVYTLLITTEEGKQFSVKCIRK